MRRWNGWGDDTKKLTLAHSIKRLSEQMGFCTVSLLLEPHSPYTVRENTDTLCGESPLADQAPGCYD
jgi:hypothetical protein